MTQTMDQFKKSTKAEWEAILTKELKGAPLSSLIKTDPIEEFSFPSAIHADDFVSNSGQPGAFPFTRGFLSNSNEWGNTATIDLGNYANEKEMNEVILHWLMNGASSIYILDTSSKTLDADLVFKSVGFEFIHVFVSTEKDDFIKYLQQKCGNRLTVFSGNGNGFVANGYSVQQAGGTTWQELSIALAEAHDYLVVQLDNGISAEDALSSVQFVMGIGSNYLFEIAKFRALRTLWATISSAYHSTFVPPLIIAKSGFVHLSLKDPTTNLLRQTTQAMSAVVGGVDQLIIQPYDLFALNKDVAFTTRMAVNIGNLLADESYLNQVQDIAGGSYVSETISETITERAWAEFKRIEREGGLSKMIDTLKLEINAKRDLRSFLLHNGTTKLIGVNVFPNPQLVDNHWVNVPTAWQGLSTFIYEENV